MSTKLTQKRAAFYKLLSEYRQEKKAAELADRAENHRYIPTWEFGGEMLIKELNEWVLMTYKCPTRLTDLYQENPTLLERELLTGKSGAHYYGYRIRSGAGAADIKDSRILDFYRKITV